MSMITLVAAASGTPMITSTSTSMNRPTYTIMSIPMAAGTVTLMPMKWDITITDTAVITVISCARRRP
jgi:hypothetical protein